MKCFNQMYYGLCNESHLIMNLVNGHIYFLEVYFNATPFIPKTQENDLFK